MANPNTTTVFSPSENSIKIHKWKVREGFQVTTNQVILLYELVDSDDKEVKRFKSTKCGLVKKRHFKEGDVVDIEKPLLDLSDCIHTTVIKDMCADCGADLRQDDNGNQSEASVPMVHSWPELKVSQKLAQELGKADTARLLKDRKLVLLVDLDQTIIHTTNDIIPNNLKEVYHFQLYGPHSPWYHTRLRPGTFEFLNNVEPYFELHICTFGAKRYAHTIVKFLDEKGKYFSHRILSRDDCLSLTSKTDNLKALFPCGDSMVCIIDDREDVWNMATNLIQVKPYHFFQHTGDINAPPGMSKHELDGKGINFKDIESKLERQKELTENKSEKKNDSDNILANEDELGDLPNLEDGEVQEEIDTKPNHSEEARHIEADSTSKKNSINDEELPDQSAEGTVNEADKEKLKSKENDKLAARSENKNESNSVEDELSNEETGRTVELKTAEAALSADKLIQSEDSDDYLLYLESILLKIHSRFYEFYDENKQIPDLKTLVPKIRSEVLVGKTLVFSGLVPNQIKLEKSRAYMIARSLGANVTQQLTDETTHLVASTAGTFKVNAARKSSTIKIVSPEWLWSCAERWECVEEILFPLDSKKASKTRQPPAHCHSPEHVVNYNMADSAVAEPSAAHSRGEASTATDDKMNFIDTINPLLTFSKDELAAMNDDVDEYFQSDSSDEEPVDIENPPVHRDLRKRKLCEESVDEHQKLFKLTQSDSSTIHIGPADEDIEDIDHNSSNSSSNSNSSSSSSNNISIDSDNSNNGSPADDQDDGDWHLMGAALEREFLGSD